HPLAHLPDRARADVSVHVGVGAEQFAQCHEFVRAEVVVLHDVAPVRVDHAGTFRTGADAVAPVVLLGEATAGPAQVRDPQLSQCLHDVASDPTLVGDVGVLTDPEPSVDAPPQVFGEVAVQVAADGGSGQVEVDDGGRAHRGSSRGCESHAFGVELHHDCFIDTVARWLLYRYTDGCPEGRTKGRKP